MDDKTFAAELDKLRPYVAKLATRLAPAGLVDDLVQDALVLAWEKRAQMHTNMGGWLRRIVVCIYINQRNQRAKRRRDICLADLRDEPDALVDNSDLCQQVFDRELVRRALASLYVRKYADFLLSGMGQNEYADAHGIKRNTMRTRVMRMKRQMAQEGLLCD